MQESSVGFDCSRYFQGLGGYSWATVGEAMMDVREAVHEELDRMCEDELLGFVEFLTTYPTPDAAASRTALIDREVDADEREEPKDETRDRY